MIFNLNIKKVISALYLMQVVSIVPASFLEQTTEEVSKKVGDTENLASTVEHENSVRRVVLAEGNNFDIKALLLMLGGGSMLAFAGQIEDPVKSLVLLGAGAGVFAVGNKHFSNTKKIAKANSGSMKNLIFAG